MDVKEKLVELLKEIVAIQECGFGDPRPTYETVASYLMSNGVTVQDQDGCEYCNGLPFSQMEDFTMPNASKKDYDIVTIHYCPICGRRLPQPLKGE